MTMKRLFNCILVLIVSLAMLYGCSTPKQEAQLDECYRITPPPPVEGTVQRVKFELAAPLTEFPDAMQVYEMVKPAVTEDYVLALATKFGLKGELSSGEDTFLISDNETDTILQVYKATGTFRYGSPSKMYPGGTPNLPSDEEALKIATDFLVQRDLLPRGDVASKVTAGGKANGVTTHLLVSFDHTVGITGPGARHGVRIGDGGEVIQVFINPTNPLDLPPHAMMKVKSSEQAFEEMKAERRYYAGTETQKVVIDSVFVAYWLEPIDEGQEYVVPAYVFKGRCFDTAGKQLEDTFVEVVEALIPQ